MNMAISISLITLLAVAVWMLYRFAALKLWHGLVCILFGFYLASSSVAPPIDATVNSIIRALTGHG
jgi:predicted membrane metal-binding protein